MSTSYYTCMPSLYTGESPPCTHAVTIPSTSYTRMPSLYIYAYRSQHHPHACRRCSCIRHRLTYLCTGDTKNYLEKLIKTSKDKSKADGFLLNIAKTPVTTTSLTSGIIIDTEIVCVVKELYFPAIKDQRMKEGGLQKLTHDSPWADL